MSRFTGDIRIALRGFRRTPAFAITVVLILGLAIGMTTAMTSVFRSVLVQRLPVQDEEAIVLPRVFDRTGVEIGMLPEQLKEFRRTTRTLSIAAGVLHWGATQFPFRNGDHPLVLKRSFVTGNFFDVLGTRPVLGRLLHDARLVLDDERATLAPDTPGDEQYRRNMLTGASTADLAIVLVDARKGVLPQTRLELPHRRRGTGGARVPGGDGLLDRALPGVHTADDGRRPAGTRSNGDCGGVGAPCV